VNRSTVAGATLTAFAVVALTPAAVPVIGAFAPQLPLVGRFGVLVIPDLQWIGALALMGLVLSALALGTSGGRATTGLLVVSAGPVVGIALIAIQLLLLANANGASFDLGRQVSSVAALRGPNERGSMAAHGAAPELAIEIWWAHDQAPSAPGFNDPNVVRNVGPAVLFLHGGGFWGGGLRSRPALFAALADKGYTVYDAEYRLSPPPRWDQAPGDALCALAYVQGMQVRLGGDPNQVVIIGESAGGYLALMAAYTAGTDRGKSSCGGTPAPPAAVIAISPTADLEGIWQDGSLSNEGSLFPVAYMGATPMENLNRYDDSEPMNLVRPDVPPTLVLIAANDHLVHPLRSRAIVDALEQAGAEYKLIVVPFADHGFDGAANAFGEQLEEAVFPAFIEAHT
jgi:acetyl esterase/lipase